YGGDGSMSGTIVNAHRCELRIQGVRVQLPSPHSLLQFVEIDRSGRGLTAEDRSAPAMNRLLLSLCAVDFVTHLIVAGRKQGNGHFRVSGDHHRLSPDRI